MSALSLQITRTCRENPDLGFCKIIEIVAPIIFVFFTLAIPFIIYTVTFKDENFKKDNNETKLAKLSFWGCIGFFMVGTSLQLLGFIPESLPVFNYSFIPLLGIIPLLIKSKEDFLNPLKETFSKSSIKGKIGWGVVIIIILMGICSIAWLMLNP